MGTCGDTKNAQQDQQIEAFLAGVRHKLLVMSGKGGVGKSTVAANLALTLSSQGYKVGLLDADLHGPSIAGLFGVTGIPLNTIGNCLQPYLIDENLKVITIQGVLKEPDAPLIWRGPMKIGIIRQLLAEVDWGKLDFLIIDSPPGTGDEPLTIAQTIKGCKAVVVTTPQEVALADVRKSLTFCNEIGMDVLGIVENMSGFTCPSCGSVHDIFKTGGGEALAQTQGISFLGKIPIDPTVVTAADNGLGMTAAGTAAQQSMQHIANTVLQKLQPSKKESGGKLSMKIAIPLAGGNLCNHFGHCEEFAIASIEQGNIAKLERLTPPPHEPGVIPNWLAEQQVTTVLAGGMGEKAQAIFAQKGIKVQCGVMPDSLENMISQYLSGTLKTTVNACNHEEGDHHHCH